VAGAAVETRGGKAARHEPQRLRNLSGRLRSGTARGAGLSDSPYGGRDGDLWRGGVRSWLDEHRDETGDLDAAGLDPEKTTAQDVTGRPISTRVL
jgi:hypothetical protein